ncbi:hypothetical protein I5H84_gp087 [Mycobacterium phage RitaG]|uniref:Uncharacterized protein n=24 Tax=Cheoctovirus TaxID=1623281 RepID=A0A249XQ57_9CAUD|nr:hypothetical protein N856_gp086 [Mycobacterium phage Daenerys]YP_009198194.1 hypothetical protein SEA_KIMBERLIUM_90 [Mycobacterium phage Kimberlium]YP_009956009.1 hypothetical protein I5H27_gp091 [Mycobacterium phage DillTech15]YP_009957701.1 hypothetical protein I5H43_gp085 [Mycobacterium phage Girr]YP_009960770.1 hypothetical protein I5H73_gp084 [Mycobacterium phage OldBen]YP_009960980.1 hypothetical protein I5H75_gp086 [Mycobacterium phage OwlsT2W]YP_009961080.1 hypothetical protein I5H
MAHERIVLLMPWVKITCTERDELMSTRDLVPFSSCTDLDAEFHSEPQMDIEWAERGADQPVLREHRYPARTYLSDEPGTVRPDRKPCEHYRYEAQP